MTKYFFGFSAASVCVFLAAVSLCFRGKQLELAAAAFSLAELEWERDKTLGLSDKMALRILGATLEKKLGSAAFQLARKLGIADGLAAVAGRLDPLFPGIAALAKEEKPPAART